MSSIIYLKKHKLILFKNLSFCQVWGLTVHNLVYSFPGEHTRGSIFRNTAVGVSQVTLTPQHHLFSCGADGSMKVRQLPWQQLVDGISCSALSLS